MSEDALFLVLDQGGHSGRALVFDAAGGLAAEARETVRTRREDGRVEQDAEELLDSLVRSIARIAKTLGPRCAQLRAAGLAVQRSSMLCWDRASGVPLSPVISWQDRRGGTYLVASGLGNAEVAEVTGLRFSPHYGAGKLRWCLDHLPAVQKALHDGRLGWGPLGSFLLFRLLRERPYLVDATLAQRTMLCSRHTRDWSSRLVEAFGIPARSLPAVVPNRYVFGNLPVGGTLVPLQICIGDQSAVPWATGRPSQANVHLNIGSGAFVLRPFNRHAVMPNGLLQTLLWDEDRRAWHALEGTVNGAGNALSWLADRRDRPIPWQNLDELLDRRQDEARDCVFLNGVGGLGSPWWVPEWRSYFDPESDFPSELCAVLESIAFLLHVNVVAADGVAGTASRAILSGGLSRLTGFCQLLTDLLQKPVWRLGHHDATAAGVLRLLQADKGAREMPEGEVFTPVRRPGLQARFRRWLSLLPPLPAMSNAPL